jgi:predicted MPP superfamily phosphohydrolase
VGTRFKAAAVVLLCSVGGLAAYATSIEPYAIRLARFELLCPRLPRSFDGLNVLQITDTHVACYGRLERKIAAIASEVNADLIALTGDLVHTPAGIDPFLKTARAFRARLGMFAVYGNSEHKNGIVPANLAATLADNGIQPLLNRSISISNGSGRIYVCGVDDPVTHHHNVEKALEGVPDEAFKLLLMHSPDAIGEAAHRGVDLVLSGHTHGGQVCLPIVGALYTHSMLGRRMCSGYYGQHSLQSLIGLNPGRTQLYVSRGAGTSGLALRFLCPPQMTLITLRAV